MAVDRKASLQERLAKALPKGCRFIIHHLSTPPTECPAIFAAPPGEVAEETYCESHFLSVSIESDGRQLQVFAVEVLIYTTEYLITLFVSKADSTGYLHKLNLPQGTPSSLRVISTTFLQYLIEERRRPDRRLVLSLFARAQNQYLFPGSVENSDKHVLDDRGLIKWWCKVVDSILLAYENHNDALACEKDNSTIGEPHTESHGYIRVPGCDTYETLSFIPMMNDTGGKKRWSATDPLCEFCRSPQLPERCLIPRLPDDPKARFIEQLDDELPNDLTDPSLSQTQDGHPTTNGTGRWKSVQSLEQFWEMMSYRQECSSGRLVGFLWAVFPPNNVSDQRKLVDAVEDIHQSSQSVLITPLCSYHQGPARLTPQSPLESSPIAEVDAKAIALLESTPVNAKDVVHAQPEETRSSYWPLSSRGEVILRQKDYHYVGNLLLRLDYANEDIAADSTKKWTDKVAERVGVKSWGRTVVGESVLPVKNAIDRVDAAPTVLNAGLIRKKKRPAENADGLADGLSLANGASIINMLPTGLARKKAKVDDRIRSVSLEAQSNGNADPG